MLDIGKGKRGQATYPKSSLSPFILPGLLQRHPRLLLQETPRDVRLHLQKPPEGDGEAQHVLPHLAPQELPRREVRKPHQAAGVRSHGLPVGKDADDLAGGSIGDGHVLQAGAVVVGKHRQGRELVRGQEKGDRLRLLAGRVDGGKGDKGGVSGGDLGDRQGIDERLDQLRVFLVEFVIPGPPYLFPHRQKPGILPPVDIKRSDLTCQQSLNLLPRQPELEHPIILAELGTRFLRILDQLNAIVIKTKLHLSPTSHHTPNPSRTF